MTILWNNILIMLAAGLLGIAIVVLGIIGLIYYARKTDDHTYISNLYLEGIIPMPNRVDKR